MIGRYSREKHDNNRKKDQIMVSLDGW